MLSATMFQLKTVLMGGKHNIVPLNLIFKRKHTLLNINTILKISQISQEKNNVTIKAKS